MLISAVQSVLTTYECIACKSQRTDSIGIHKPNKLPLESVNK